MVGIFGDSDFGEMMGKLFRQYSVPPQSQDFEKASRVAKGNVTGLLNNVGDTQIVYGVVRPNKVSARELLSDPYVNAELEKDAAWNNFGRVYRMGSDVDVAGLAEYAGRVPLLRKLFD